MGAFKKIYFGIAVLAMLFLLQTLWPARGAEARLADDPGCGARAWPAAAPGVTASQHPRTLNGDSLIGRAECRAR